MTLSKRVDSLVSLQVRRWGSIDRHEAVRPCVAIANLPGSGGGEVGRLAAEALGYGLFGREIVDEIAKRRNVSEELVRGLDQRVRSVIDRYVADSFGSRSFSEADYLTEVVRTVTTLGQRGMAVVVGRGSAFILRPEVALRVLVIAPRPFRIERWCKLHGLDAERAAQAVDAEDARRVEFVRHSFGARLDDPVHYDLVVNTGMLGFETAARAIVGVLRERFPG
jgi:cytidylate kinase